jgi:hypothetical protein
MSLGGKDILSVGCRGENLFLDPFPIGKHSRLVTARTEIAGFARVGEQVIVTALSAIDSGEAVVQVAAVQQAFEDLGLDGASDQAGGCEFVTMTGRLVGFFEYYIKASLGFTSLWKPCRFFFCAKGHYYGLISSLYADFRKCDRVTNSRTEFPYNLFWMLPAELTEGTCHSELQTFIMLSCKLYEEKLGNNAKL